MKNTISDQELLAYNMKVDNIGIIVSTIISVLLCVSGVVLLLFNPPVWGQVLGIPYSIGGFALAIISFDRVNRPRADSKIDRQDLEDERDFLKFKNHLKGN